MDHTDATMDMKLEQARRELAASEAAAAADGALIGAVDRVLDDLRGERAVNTWRDRVAAAFQASRGAGAA